MPTLATSFFDGHRGGTLWARIPEALGDAQRRAKYDDPLALSLAEEGIENTIRGFSIPPTADDSSASVGIEVHVAEPQAVALVAQAIADLGAPSATVLEVETDKASIRLTLAEAQDG